jgi:GT2 family glycosyltransferase
VWPWIGALVPGAIQPLAVRARTEPWRLERTIAVAWLTGACVAAPRGVLRELGPFDPAIHLYGEDMDLGLRAARAGVGSWFCPGVCTVVHRGGASAAGLDARDREHRVAATRRAVVRRAYGKRRERAAWLADRLKLRMRVIAKGALRRDTSRERDALSATRVARPGPLPDPPGD